MSPSNSTTSLDDVASTPPDMSLPDSQDQTTPKASPSVPPPQLVLPENSGSSLMPPPSFIRPFSSSSSSLAPSVSTLPVQKRPRQKVVLAPGHSPLDWARLKSSNTDLRQTQTPFLLRIPPSELKRHRRRNDAWMAINGKVYNVTSYLPFHPGGEKEMMRAAGRDGTKLFMEFHAWVNPETMLDKCLIGFMVPEPETEETKISIPSHEQMSRAIYRETKLKKEFLKMVRDLSYNSLCADCPCNNENYIRRANTRIGVFLCFYCAKAHIQLFGEGSESFAGKTVDKRFHEWTDQEMRMMFAWGNYKANIFWGGKMSEEQATEEGRLTFIRAKYFGRDMGVPELEWYVDVERSLDPTMDVVFPTDETAWDGQDVEDVEVIETVTLKDIIPVKALAKKKRARRVSVSSSDSDGSISQVLKEVVKDYAATHSRTTRAEGRMTEKTSVTEKVFDDLICFD